MNLSYLPNALTLSRIALVPLLILALKDQEYTLALGIFLIAGVTDAADGYAAKRLNVMSRLGAILDPAADKILLVSAYVMLTLLGHIPFWLMLSVVFRDLLIVGGYLAYSSLVGTVQMCPSPVSKLNTVLQIGLIGLILAQQAGVFDLPAVIQLLVFLVLVTTVASGAHYVWIWGIQKDLKPAAAGKPANVNSPSGGALNPVRGRND
ncbi:MAG: CDP-alcohol phosphatidyltransferase family protein [Gammaproteobacteria bacterium]|nr:CDP-alcohol phosphatidyltransferase family protein [Gammaproteobacteria bacterium]